MSKRAARPVGTGSRWIVDLAEMSPAIFGLVMATGIVSLAAFMMDHRALAMALFYLNVVQYGVLWVLYALRVWYHPRRFFGDMVAHLTGPGYFTVVAGTGILASQFIILQDNLEAGFALWLLAIVLWVALTYTIFTAFTVKRDKPSLDRASMAVGCLPWWRRRRSPSPARCWPPASASRTGWN